jgi:hypothetical protein
MGRACAFLYRVEKMAELVIKDQAHYDRSLEWLTARAEIIVNGDKEHNNPLLDKEAREAWKQKRDEHMRNYNIVADALKMFSQPEMFDTEK